MSDRGTVTIVGAGVLGATLAHRLAVEGWQVTVIDQHEPGTPFGSQFFSALHELLLALPV